ncbi:hypothetical protein QPK87_21195 [Kamptonema cortianum]|jgi:uncharacterized protein YjeT (DUF2065 family)|nr:hypothetical protein [Geitlerinema splendidum]MDK3159071.1 hypothetical protein [Kamptonema cortianum]
MSETELTLEIVGKGNFFAPYSARECIQTLTPIPQGSLRRTINGRLVWVGQTLHRKFKSTITCKDKAPPAFDGLWRGDKINVTCLQTLTQSIPQEAQEVTLEREPASICLYDHSGKIWPAPIKQLFSLPADFSGGFVIYAPQLSMLVENYTLEVDEWGLTSCWTLELVEV